MTEGQKYIEEKVARFPKGKIVNVFYNPKTPEKSVLINGVHSTTLIFSLFGFGLLFFMVSNVGLYLKFKS